MTTTVLDLDEWERPANATELRLLARLRGPVLDVGCGPGRLVAALRARGVVAHGIDAAPAAVARARRQGVAIWTQSVFDPVPDEGRWSSVLLLDGNVGIGGDPVRLLLRSAALLKPRGVVLVELGTPGIGTRHGVVELEVATGMVGHFAWCWVAADDVDRHADAAALTVVRRASYDGRWFAWLRTSK
jgi:SAM-dependent methyltransferase